MPYKLTPDSQCEQTNTLSVAMVLLKTSQRKNLHFYIEAYLSYF